MDIVGSEHVVGHVALIDIDVRPLSALSLVACHGIGILHLQGIVIRVLAQRLKPVRLQGQVLIVSHHVLEQFFVLFACQRRCFSLKRVENGGGSKLKVVVVGKRESDVGEVETVKVTYVSHPQHSCPVAVGNERQLQFQFFCPVVVVFHHHQHVALCHESLTSQHHVPYTIIIYYGTLVASCHHDGVVEPSMAVRRCELFNQFVATEVDDVAEPMEVYLRQLCHFLMCYHLPHLCGIVQNA